MSSADDERTADLADLIQSVARKIGAHEREAGIARLSSLESLALRFVDRNHGVKPSDIAVELGLQSGNMSAALRALEAKGLVRRSADPVDRRAVRVESTALAADNLRRLREEWIDLLTPLLPDGHDVGSIVRFLEELDEAFHPGRAAS